MENSKIEKTRINNKLPIAREGIPFFLLGTCITIILWYIQLSTVGIFFGILTLFTIFFFRDPERTCDTDNKTVIIPADGRIISVLMLDDSNNPLGEPAIKVSIFMSIFNVHVNRVPISGRVSNISYHQGRFFSANLDKASDQNENNQITIQTDEGPKIVFIQIAGLIARRIVCWINEQEYVKIGQRFGLIRFGSRVDIFLPIDTNIIIRPKQMVKAGETILGYLS